MATTLWTGRALRHHLWQWHNSFLGWQASNFIRSELSIPTCHSEVEVPTDLHAVRCQVYDAAARALLQYKHSNHVQKSCTCWVCYQVVETIVSYYHSGRKRRMHMCCSQILVRLNQETYVFHIINYKNIWYIRKKNIVLIKKYVLRIRFSINLIESKGSWMQLNLYTES